MTKRQSANFPLLQASDWTGILNQVSWNVIMERDLEHLVLQHPGLLLSHPGGREKEGFGMH